MTHRTIVITGASDGIGASAARTLSAQGNRVIVIGRNPDKTRKVAEEAGADYLTADFSELGQVRELAGELRSKCPRIDVLVNNAGGLMGKRAQTDDGHERTFQVNHLGAFLLTTELLTTLQESSARVITTSSAAHMFGRVNLDDLEVTRYYTPMRAYGISKLENILFTRELNRRYGPDSGEREPIRTAAFHPGVVKTSFSSGSSSPFRYVYSTVMKPILKTPEEGASTLVWLATAPEDEWVSGGYYANKKLTKTYGQANDVELARELWDRSAELVLES